MNRCAECPHEFDPINGSGPRQSRLLWIGERPGRRENDRGRVFIGPTGEEYDNTYLPAAGMRRPDVRVENCVRCWALGNRAPTEKEALSCARHFLPDVLRECEPEVVVLMGGSAHRIVDVLPDEKRPRVDMIHGRPFYGSLLGGIWEGWIWSSYHPALGMHATEKMWDLLADFKHLGQWLEGDWVPPSPPEGIVKDYGLLDSCIVLRGYLRDQRERQRGDYYRRAAGVGEYHPSLYTDTERHGRDPWSVQFSLNPHSARLLRYQAGDACSAALCAELRAFIQETRAEIVLHNAGQDQDELDKMRIPSPLFSDTMGEAFNLCYLPQGLKALAYRLFGVTMRSWEDTVWPASVAAVSAWMRDAVELARENLGDVKVDEMKTFTCHACGHKAHAGKTCASKAGGVSVKCGCVDGERFTNRRHVGTTGAMESILRHVLRHTEGSGDADEPYHPWRALHGTPKKEGMLTRGLRGKVPEKWEWDFLEDKLGEAPILGIGNCELQEAVDYGCSDSDHTGQVSVELARLRGDKMFDVMEADYDQ